MAPRAGSPALSENGFDISNALFGGDDQHEEDHGLTHGGVDLDLGGESDDEHFVRSLQAAANRKSTNVKGQIGKKGGGFQAMGLNTTLLKAITRKGFSIPTPIQRKAIPLILDNQDVVGMARTGSGKTAAFVIPLIEKLKTHSAKFGARGIVLSPSRELALQTLKVIKELGRGTDLRTILLVGGDSLEDQFSSMTTNPDIIIATPGRFLHLKVEMQLDLSAVRYIVFDEADRLFEMGFQAQLGEILHALPTSRQTLLFSATLPKSLVEFARAGLQDPRLIRLDAESKMSPDLQSAYFAVKSGDRDGALLQVLDRVIGIPIGPTEAARKAKESSSKTNSKKRKRESAIPNHNETPTEHSTIIFAATKHRVEYLSNLLKSSGYHLSYVYGNLDQSARAEQISAFRAGLASILITTDVAARGIDLPHLANVVNYDFPSQPKIWVHRVGRTARAGRKGWSYSLIRDSDVPYLIDLQLFLGRPLVYENQSEEMDYANSIVVGSLVPDELGPYVETVNRRIDEDEDLINLQRVADKGEAQYTRTRNSASAESVKRSRELLGARSLSSVHPLFGHEIRNSAKEDMLRRITKFKPQQSIFEVGKRGNDDPAVEIMQKMRRDQAAKKKSKESQQTIEDQTTLARTAEPAIDGRNRDVQDNQYLDSASDSDELEVSISRPEGEKKGHDWQDTDSEFFMSYQPKTTNAAEDRAYSVHTGGYSTNSFVDAARGATMDLVNDEIAGFAEASKARGLRWDKRSKKYVARANDEDGSRGKKMVTGESGMKIAASFRSGRFDDWRKANKVHRLPRTGENEGQHRPLPQQGRNYKHKAERAPKEADRYRDDYHVQKRRVQEAKEKRIGKFREGNGKNELKGVEDVRKSRKLKEKRREKNARPSKKRKV